MVRGVQGHVADPDQARNPLHDALPALAELAARRWDDGYESFPPTSLQMSNIQAGTGASNVIPGELQMVFNLRFNPHWTAAKLEAGIETLFERHRLDFNVSWHRRGEQFFTPEGRPRSTAREVPSKLARGDPEEMHVGNSSYASSIAPMGAQAITVGPVERR